MKRMIRSVLFVGFLVGAANCFAGDWPQFRYDAAHSAAAPESLADQLHLRWVRELPPPDPAFPGELRLRYDASYEPVVLGKTMFVPSMVTDSVTALDTETGEVRWRFFTGGPVRFAPVAWQKSVYFVSDDGHLYCVGADDGRLIWKHRGLPADRTDRKLLGNGRLISLWPARGGPVLADGTVYFAAGIWPSTGVFVHALEAKTGKVIWSNVDSHHLPGANLDHGIRSHAGLTPQGYLAIAGDKLVVPCGAQLPAFLDRKTGKLEKYTVGWGGRVGLPKGSWLVISNGRFLVSSGDLYDLTRKNDEKFRDARQGNFKSELYAGGYTRLQIDRTNHRALGQFRQPVLTADRMYVAAAEGIVANDLTNPQTEPRKKASEPAHRRNDQYPDRLKGVFPALWRVASQSQVHIKAGNHLYVGKQGAVEAVDLSASDQPKISWSAKIAGTPNRMLAADDKLFVVTREGHIYAFGAKVPKAVARHLAPGPAVAATDVPDAPSAELATKSLREAKVSEGYVLVLGIQSGDLVEQLVRQSKCFVIAVDRDSEKVSLLRERFAKLGLYGTRISVHQGDPLQFPFPPYLAQLITSEDISRVADDLDRVAAQKLTYMLRPYGGAACLELNDAQRKKLLADFSKWQFEGLAAEARGNLTLIARRGPLPDSDNWSHQAANSANSGSSQDRFLKGQLERLWFDGSIRWNRKPGSAEVRVAGGRVFVLADRLWAGDVYTGRQLWLASLPRGVSPRRGSDFVAVDDAIYLAAGRSCFVLDANSGAVRQEIKVPTEISQAGATWSYLRVSENDLVARLGEQVVCVDRHSGQLRWQVKVTQPRVSLAVGNGKLFCAEFVDPRRAGEKKSRTFAVDIKSGESKWEIPIGAPLRYSEAHDLLLMSAGVFKGADGSQVRGAGAKGAIAGDKLIGGQEKNMLVIYDLASGKKTFDQLQWVTRGCTPLRACPGVATTRFRANAAYIDLATQKITPLYNVRSGCNNNLVPANGILNIPNLTGGCTCNYTPTSLAFVPASVLRSRSDPKQ